MLFPTRRNTFLFCVVGFLATWHSALCLMGLATGILYVTTHLYGPTRRFKPEDRADILENCETVSTDDRQDLMLYPHHTADEVFDLMNEHGVAIIPAVLQRSTAQSLRDFVLQKNDQMRQIHVLKKDHRYNIMPGTPFEEPIIAEVMKEVGTHPKLKPLLDDVLGPKSSLIAFSVITSTYGAKKQNWHRDTTRSGMTHPDKFVHEVVLAIPLQDTTKEMGATGICPGTHDCHQIEAVYSDVPKQESIPCNITADVSQGDALLYHSDVIHRGGAHVDPKAPDRSVLFISFAESKPKSTFKRLAYGNVYSLNYRLWGLNLDDFPHLGGWQWKWSFLHPLGLRFWTDEPALNADGDITTPWNVIDAFIYIFDRESKVFHTLDSSFDADKARKLSSKLVMWLVVSVGLYIWAGIPLWLYVGRELWQRGSGTRKQIV